MRFCSSETSVSVAHCFEIVHSTQQYYCAEFQSDSVNEFSEDLGLRCVWDEYRNVPIRSALPNRSAPQVSLHIVTE